VIEALLVCFKKIFWNGIKVIEENYQMIQSVNTVCFAVEMGARSASEQKREALWFQQTSSGCACNRVLQLKGLAGCVQRWKITEECS
jgi:hypothetical protein